MCQKTNMFLLCGCLNFTNLLQTIAGGGRNAQKYFRREKYKGTVKQDQTDHRTESIDKLNKKQINMQKCNQANRKIQ